MITQLLDNAAAVVTIVAALGALALGVWRVLRKLEEILRVVRVAAGHERRITRLEQHAGLPPLIIREEPS